MTFDPLDRRTEPGNELVRLPVGHARRHLRRLELGIQCEFCGRGWRLSHTQILSSENAQFLYDHVDLHVRDLARRPSQTWQA